jgi:hypothetical protein
MFFSSYSQNNIASSEIKNSIFNILPYNLKSFKNKKIKIHNIIRGSYKDKILDDLVYVSSSNINKDFFLRKDKQKLFSTEKAFISHLNLENNNNIIDFHHYCNTYYRQFYKNNIIIPFIIFRKEDYKVNDINQKVDLIILIEKILYRILL